MRQIFVQVPRRHGDKARDIIAAHKPVNMTQFKGEDGTRLTTDFVANVSNSKIEGVLDELSAIPHARITLIPKGVLAFTLDSPHIPDQVTSIDLLSPVEVFLSGLQSIGSWRGFLGYAAAAAVLVWLGLFLNSVVLLIAGMLVSPFASPAMNLAIASARGDTFLLRQSLLRYSAALATAIAVGAALTIVLDLNIITQQMDTMSQVSQWAVLIPLVVGAGGALSMIQSGSSSLVSGTVSGLLVAASLAPPVILIGIGLGMGKWDLIRTSTFVVLLQLVGINLTGATILRINDLKAKDARHKRGNSRLFPVVMLVTLAALAGLLVWQQADPVALERSSLAQEVAMDIRRVVDDDPLVDLIELQTRFTKTEIKGQNSLLVVLYVQPSVDGAAASADAIRVDLRQAIIARLQEKEYHVTPLIDIGVLAPPS